MSDSCACRGVDSFECVAIRYERDYAEVIEADDGCDCGCHFDELDDDELDDDELDDDELDDDELDEPSTK